MALVSLTSDFPFSMAALTSSSVSFPLTRSRALHNSAHSPLISLPSYSFPVSLRSKPLNAARTAPLNPGTRCMLESKSLAVTKDSWNKMVLNSETPVLVEFYANWCGPCRMVHRLIDEIAAEYGGRLQCYVLNTDKDLQVAEDYEIKAVPVVMLFKNGEKCESVVGTMPKDFYVAAIERVLKQ